MVDRYLFVKLLDGEVAARDAIAAHVRDELRWAAGASNVSVGVPADDSAARWDLSIAVRVDNLAAWERIAAAPRVAAMLGTWLPERAAVIKAWSFEIRA